MTAPTARVQLLRELAAEMDCLADSARAGCSCPVHKVLAREYDQLATRYRQRALEETVRPTPREADRG